MLKMYFIMLLLFIATIISLSHILSQVKITRSACDMWQVWHVSMSSPPHASHPNIIGKLNSSHYPGHLESRRSRCWSLCNNDGEVKMRNCNQAFLQFKCSLAQQNMWWNALCTVWFIFFGKYLVLWSPKCLVTPSQVRPQPRIIINDLLMLESNSFKSQ